MQEAAEAAKVDHRHPICKQCMERNCAECTKFGTTYILTEPIVPLWTAEERRKHIPPLSELIKKRY